MRPSPERSDIDNDDESRVIHFAGPAFSIMRWISTSAFVLIGTNQTDAMISRKNERPAAAALMEEQRQESSSEKLRRIIMSIASHRHVSRQSAEEAATTLNMAEFVLRRSDRNGRSATVKALENVDAALRLMPTDRPLPFRVEWNGTRWTVKQAGQEE